MGWSVAFGNLPFIDRDAKVLLWFHRSNHGNLVANSQKKRSWCWRKQLYKCKFLFCLATDRLPSKEVFAFLHLHAHIQQYVVISIDWPCCSCCGDRTLHPSLPNPSSDASDAVCTDCKKADNNCNVHISLRKSFGRRQSPRFMTFDKLHGIHHWIRGFRFGLLDWLLLASLQSTGRW